MFTDACRDAAVVPATITYPELEYGTDLTFSLAVDPFGDNASLGDICGEKKFELASSAPTSLSVRYSATPTGSPFYIDYVQGAVSDDKNPTVDYTVTAVDYAGIIPVLSGQFELVIIDTCEQTSLFWSDEKLVEDISVDALQTETVTKTYSAYQNTVGVDLSDPLACGKTLYSIQGVMPSFLSFNYSEEEALISFTVDVSSETDSGTFTIVLIAELENYPETETHVEFIVDIQP